MMRRGKFFYFTIIVAMTAIMMRCFFLATGGNAARATVVVGGRRNELLLYRTKGMIYDENMEPIAGGQPCWYLVINPRDFDQKNLNAILRYSKARRSIVVEKLKKETPFVLMSKEQPIAMAGVMVVKGVGRYSGVAQHLLGYLDQRGEVGLSGIEKEYDEYLELFSSSVSVTYSADALQGAIAGLGIETEAADELSGGVVLTLNKPLCEALEQAVNKHIDCGAAIVLDCRSGEMKALCSAPSYEEGRIADYLNSNNGELINRALGAQTVGSVFKIIVAACALEAGMGEFSYDCEGGIQISNWTFACHQHEGHGKVGLKEAFAQSCNSFFIALGQLLGYDRIAEMAERFGYGREILLSDELKSACGNVPKNDGALALANLCIGQGALTASPLHVALMTAAIANGGVLPSLNLIKGIYLNGELKEESPSVGMRILSEETAESLRQYCVYTVEEGTGTNAKPSVGSAGGKTASAQTGTIKNGTEKLNVYFTGFYPAENPQYVITVFAEDGASGGKTCAPVFREICDFISENNLTDGETVVY